MNEQNPLNNVNWYNPLQKKSGSIYVFRLKSTSVPDMYIYSGFSKRSHSKEAKCYKF